VNRPRELHHDAQLYRAYQRAEKQLRDEGAEIRRVVLEQELKREYRSCKTLDFDAIEIGGMRLPSFPPQLVPDAIEHRLTEVRLQRTDTARLEGIDPLKRLNQGVLDKIIGIGEIARPLRQAAAGPSLQRFEMSREESFQRLLVTRPGPLDQMKGRFDID
jgi:hypothetical protein